MSRLPLFLLAAALVALARGCSGTLAAAVGGVSCPSPSSPFELQRNGQPETSFVLFARGEVHQVPFRLLSTVQIVGLVLDMRGDSNTGRIIARAALYDSESALVAQSSLVNVSAGGRDLLFPLQPEPVTVSAGDYRATFIFDGDVRRDTLLTYGGTGERVLESFLDVDPLFAVGGSFPTLLAAPVVLLWGPRPAAAFVRLYGSTCGAGGPAALPAPIRLNESAQRILDRIRDRYKDVVAIGAAVIQTPDDHSSTSGVSSPANARCPFLPLAIAASGIRRIDSLQPQNVTANDTFFPHAAATQLTALLTNMAVQAGLLSFSSTIKSVFPYLPWTGEAQPRQCECGPMAGRGYFGQSPLSCETTIHPDWRYVTVAHLLTQTAGLLDLVSSMQAGWMMEELFRLEEVGQAENCTEYRLPSRRFFLQQLLCQSIPGKPPGINSSSNLLSLWSGGAEQRNLDPVVLGLMLEEVHAAPWETLAAALMRDLGMTTAGFGVPEEGLPLQQHEQRPHGHWRVNGSMISSDWTLPKAWRPAVGIHVSLMDWARLMACQLQRGRDLTAFGYPSPGSGFPEPSSPPYLLTADEWTAASLPPVSLYSVVNPTRGGSLLSLKRRNEELEPEGSGRLSDSFWEATASRFRSMVSFRLQMSPAVAVLVVVNSEVTWDALAEAREALLTIYQAWKAQQNSDDSQATAASSSSSAGAGAPEDDSSAHDELMAGSRTVVVSALLASCGLMAAIGGLLWTRRDRQVRGSGSDVVAPGHDAFQAALPLSLLAATSGSTSSSRTQALAEPLLPD